MNTPNRHRVNSLLAAAALGTLTLLPGAANAAVRQLHSFSLDLGSSADEARSVATNYGDYIYVTGVSAAGGVKQIWVGKLDPRNTANPVVAEHRVPGTGPTAGNGVAVTSDSESIYVTGVLNDDLWVGKFSANYSYSYPFGYRLNLMASAVLDGAGHGPDAGLGVSIGTAGPVYVTGYVTNAAGNKDIWIGKFSENLVLLASVTVNGAANGHDAGRAISVSDYGYPYLAGDVRTATQGQDIWIASYSPDLVLYSSRTVNGNANGDDTARAISARGVYRRVVGTVTEIAGGKNIWVGELDQIWSLGRAYSINGPGNGDDVGVGVQEKVLVGAMDVSDPARKRGYMAEIDLYYPSPVIRSSATFVMDLGEEGQRFSGVYVVGSAGGDLSVSDHGGPWFPRQASQATGRPLGTDTIEWTWPAAVGADGYVIETYAHYNGPKFTSISLPPTTRVWVQTGLAPATTYQCFVRTTNTSGYAFTSGSTATLAPADAFQRVIPSTSGVLPLNPEWGETLVMVPTGAFVGAVTVRIATEPVHALPFARPSPDRRLRDTAIAFRVTAQNLQPRLPLTITVRYRDADVKGLEEQRLVLARYNPATLLWEPLPSKPAPKENQLTATVDHLSLFRVMEAVAPGSAGTAVAYPNPFRPSKGHREVILADLPAGAAAGIYTFSGARVRGLTADSGGRAAWDGRNDAGDNVASGVYFLRVESADGDSILKLVVQR